jgi:hypothetical protein
MLHRHYLVQVAAGDVITASIQPTASGVLVPGNVENQVKITEIEVLVLPR